jgi:type II secretory pathway predicted ATPase ExeA
MRDPVFGFSGPPFASTPDPNCWAPLAGQQQAFESLAQCLESGRGIAILTAPAGTGKSLLCQRIADRLHNDRVAYLPGGRFDGVPALLQAVLFELGWPYQGLATQELRLQLTTALREIRRESDGTVLILDEAHRCSEDVLEELRAATNLCSDGRPLLRVLLSGQYALEEMLTSPQLDALNQRIGCHVSLEALTRSESADFIAYRLQRAGAVMQDVIAPPALQTICHASAGNPRCLNRLCDRSFELAAKGGRKPLDDVTVRIALEELKRLPLHWNDPPPPPADTTEPSDTVGRDVADSADVRTDDSVALHEDVGSACDDGETAVVEFGAGDLPDPSSRPSPRPVGTPERSRPPDVAKVSVPATPTTLVPAAVESSREEEVWTPVDPILSTRREPSVTAPEICFATQPGQPSARIQPAHSAKRKPQTSTPQPMQEETVDDHYAALVEQQRRQPPTVPPILSKPAAKQSSPKPVDPEPATPDEAIDRLLAVVADAVEEADVESDVAAAPASRTRRTDAEPVRFHSIEDYLQSARQDTVRMDRQEPNPKPSRHPSTADAREVDLYARLRRLRDSDA